MADITITAANVLKGTAARTVEGTAAVTIAAGQTVYLDSSVNTYKLADNSASTTDLVAGIALHSSVANQPIVVQASGNIDLGATLTTGETYVLSTTAGGIAPIADLATTEYVTILGVATGTGNLLLAINNTGIQKP